MSIHQWVSEQFESFCVDSQIQVIDLTSLAKSAHSRIERYPPKCVAFAVLETRVLGQIQAIERWIQCNSEAQVYLILGDWWQGSRRVQPITAEGVKTFYWYELTQLMMQLATGSLVTDSRISPDKLDAAATRRQIVYCCGQEKESMLALCESLTLIGHTAIGFDGCSLPVGKPSLVLWLGRTDSNANDYAESFQRLKIAYPQAYKVALIDFPRWSQAQEYLRHGFHSVSGFPADLVAIATAASRFSSAALPRK